MENVVRAANLSAVPVDLTAYFNNIGATNRDRLAEGRLNVWKNSFPAEELPDGTELFRCTQVPFRFPRTGPARLDNVVCAGQRIDLPPGRWDWIYLLACSERRAEDVVHLHYRDGVADQEWLRVSDFWPASPPHFGEVEAITCRRIHFPRHVQAGIGPRIWQQRLAISRQQELAYLRLPDNIAIHVFAMTLVANGWN
ncbi:hypothetical protein [Micromonospora sp. NPDC048898]|uniref:hypothetical protein n=1 Tax=Micromonospora sp. NPDC048898 TaxID=3364260 RepID=UPI0037212511